MSSIARQVNEGFRWACGWLKQADPVIVPQGLDAELGGPGEVADRQR